MYALLLLVQEAAEAEQAELRAALLVKQEELDERDEAVKKVILGADLPVPL